MGGFPRQAGVGVASNNGGVYDAWTVSCIRNRWGSRLEHSVPLCLVALNLLFLPMSSRTKNARGIGIVIQSMPAY